MDFVTHHDLEPSEPLPGLGPGLLDDDPQIEEFRSIMHTLPGHIWIRLWDKRKLERRLRISLVDNCNFKCFFCHNEGQGPISAGRGGSLSPEEIASLVAVAVREGVKYVKLTGGEPLLFGGYPSGIIELVKVLDSVRKPPMNLGFDLSMTTNGSLLPRIAHELQAAGLNRVTISLTTRNKAIFSELIASQDALLARSIKGLETAAELGLRPLKVNAVVYQSKSTGRGNIRELFDLIAAARAVGVDEFRIFTLLWHKDFADFATYYHFFSAEMMSALGAALSQLEVPEPDATAEVLAALGTLFADRAYPKVEFGVTTESIKIGFEAMKFGRLDGAASSQEGPYAIRLGADGGVRATLNTAPTYEFIGAIRSGAGPEEAGRLYRKALGEML